MTAHPILKSMTKQADGWVKKYVLTYEMPDGTLHEYHCATRRGEEDYAAALERNGRISRAAMQQLNDRDEATHDDVAAEDVFVPDAVCIVACTPRDTVVMEREFRYPLNSWCIALPAGLVDPGEDIIDCAIRELSEETGYEVIPDAPIYALPQAGYSSTGLTDETVQVVFVEADLAGVPHTEGSELIEVFELPLAEISSFLEENRLPIGTRAQLILELLNVMGNVE